MIVDETVSIFECSGMRYFFFLHLNSQLSLV